MNKLRALTMANKKYNIPNEDHRIVAEPVAEYTGALTAPIPAQIAIKSYEHSHVKTGRVVGCKDKEDFLAKLMQKVDVGVQDIRQGKGISKKADETTEQFFERLCTE